MNRKIFINLQTSLCINLNRSIFINGEVIYYELPGIINFLFKAANTEEELADYLRFSFNNTNAFPLSRTKKVSDKSP